MGVGAPFGWGGAHPDCQFLCLHYLPQLHKIQKIFMMACSNIFGFNPVGTPTCLHKQEVGKPSLNAAQPDAKAEGCVHDDPPRADKLRKGLSFRVGTWNVDSLTGTSGELVEALAERRMDVVCSRNSVER